MPKLKYDSEEGAPSQKKPRSREGIDEAKEVWKKMQQGMDMKWPAPAYMLANKRLPGESLTCYRDETYAVVTRWTADTKISYRPHAKSPGSKSHDRYEKYSEATTVGEALELGTLPADWCWDYERGFIKVHGPVLDEPIDMSRVQDESTLSQVDLVIFRWYRRELAKNLGLRIEELTVGKGSGESTLMRANRLVAQREATKRLDAASAECRRITDAEVLATLKEWAFARNPNRANVMREGQTWVWSDTLGLIIDRIGDVHITSATLRYPAVTRIIVQWLRERLPPEVAGFSWTSLNLNCNYSAALHRDGNNFGPSMIKAFGDFNGGELNYFDKDNKATKLDALPADKKVQFQIRDGLALFNGNCAHSVEVFKGERFSVVFFSSNSFPKATDDVMKKLEELGFAVPCVDTDPHAFLRPPPGYDDENSIDEGLPLSRFWACTELEARSFRPVALPDVPDPMDSAKPQGDGTSNKGNAHPSGTQNGKRAREESQEERKTPSKSKDKVEVTPVKTSASKDSKLPKSTSTTKEDLSYRLVDIGQTIVYKAERAGLCSALLKLAMKMEVREKGLSDHQLFEALKNADGNVSRAKQAILQYNA